MSAGAQAKQTGKTYQARPMLDFLDTEVGPTKLQAMSESWAFCRMSLVLATLRMPNSSCIEEAAL